MQNNLADNDREAYTKNIDRMNSNIDDKLKYALSMTLDIQNTDIQILSELNKQRDQINSMRQKMIKLIMILLKTI